MIIPKIRMLFCPNKQRSFEPFMCLDHKRLTYNAHCYLPLQSRKVNNERVGNRENGLPGEVIRSDKSTSASSVHIGSVFLFLMCDQTDPFADQQFTVTSRKENNNISAR